VPLIGGTLLQRLTPDQVDRALQAVRRAPTRYGTPPKQSTFDMIRAALSKAFNDAVAKGLLVKSPLRKRDRLDQLPLAPVEKALRPDELGVLRTAIGGFAHADMVRLALTTGLRLSELCGLDWQHLDFVNRRIVVNQQRIAHSPYDIEVKGPKNKKKRVVPFPPSLIERFTELKRVALLTGGGPGGGKGGAGPIEKRAVFEGVNGKNVGQRFNVFCDALGLDACTMHVLRHTYATHLVERGYNAAKVCRLMGHHNVAYTLARYYSLDDSGLMEAGPVADELLDIMDATIVPFKQA
jgi:integrase